MAKKILLLCDESDLDKFTAKFANEDVEIFSIFEHDFVEKLDFENFEQLAIDAKSLGIYCVFIFDIEALKANAADIFKKYGFETFAVSPKFLRFQLSKLDGKTFFKENGINIPKTLNLFAPIFPAVIRKNSDNRAKIIHNQREKEQLFCEFSNDFFLEEFIEGKHEKISIFFNGKNLETDNFDNINLKIFIQNLEKIFAENSDGYKYFAELEIIISQNEIYFYDIKFSNIPKHIII
ncbi:hypothetical protein J6E39_02705 [bacterium]|nr:hypothetical protein [bacterium]